MLFCEDSDIELLCGDIASLECSYVYVRVCVSRCEGERARARVRGSARERANERASDKEKKRDDGCVHSVLISAKGGRNINNERHTGLRHELPVGLGRESKHPRERGEHDILIDVAVITS